MIAVNSIQWPSAGYRIAVSPVPCQVLRFGGNPKRTDLKPAWGWKALRNGLLFLASVVGGVFAQRQAIRDFTHPFKDPEPVAVVRQEQSIGKPEPTANRVWDTTVHWGRGLLLQLLAYQALALALVTGKRGLLKTIQPETLWQDLHRQGYTGKGMKIAVLDRLVKPDTAIPPEQLFWLDPTANDVLKDVITNSDHGSVMAELIHRVLPDAAILSVSSGNRLVDHAVSAKLKGFFEQGRQYPESLTLDNLLACAEPSIRHKAEGVKLAIEQGAHVINASIEINLERLPAVIARHLNQTQAELKATLDEAQQTQLSKVITQLQKLIAQTQYPDKALKYSKLDALLEPWYEALDLAYAKEVPVVIAAGNQGDISSHGERDMSRFDLLASVPHPAVILVGSANHAGQIDGFSTEWPAHRHPDIAGNGSGELDFLERSLPMPGKKAWAKQLLLPLGEGTWTQRLLLDPPPGTSVAASDISSTIAMMKQVNPKITIRQIREILTQAAGQVSLPWYDRFHLWRKSTDREAYQQKLRQAQERRVGSGLVARLESVQLAQQQSPIPSFHSSSQS